MATTIPPSLPELEEALRQAFFLDPPISLPGFPAMAVVSDDPAISTPDVEMIFEDKVRKVKGPLLRKLSTEYPSLFPYSSLRKAKKDPFDSILRNPDKADNFFQALDTLNTTSKSHMLAKIKATLASVEKLEQSNEAKQSNETLAQIENIKQSLKSAQTSLQYQQREFSSTIPLLKTLTNLAYGKDVPRAFDPSLDISERTKRVSSIFDGMSSIFPLMKLNKEGVSPAQNMSDCQPFMNQTMSFIKDMKEKLPAVAADSRLPDLTEYKDFQYESLPTETSIRLLLIDYEGSQPDANLIKLAFHIVDLDNAPAFGALSYVWGDHRPALNQGFNKKRSQRCFEIICDGRKISVTYNLFCALRRLAAIKDGSSAQVGDSGIWIDQLCINQKNLPERNQQVAMMDRIYGQARTVTAWLGEADSHTNPALQLLEIFSETPISEHLSADTTSLILETPSDQWLSLSSLLSRPYFKRAWVVQEVALAKQLTILCGDRVIPWEHLVHLSNFMVKTKAWTLLKPHAGVFRPTDEHLLSSRWRSPIRFGQQLSALLDVRETITEKKFSPEDLLFLGQRFDATEVRDKFFAMMGLARARLISTSALVELPPVDYQASLEAVSLSFATYHITCSRSLKILSLVQDVKHRKTEDLPSWLPDPAAPLLPLPLETETGENATRWDACGSQDANPTHIVNGNTLIARGYHFDFVDEVAISFNDIAENDQWYELFEFLEPLTSKQFSDLAIDEAFWRTLITSTDPPHGKKVATIPSDLETCFGDWVISQLYSIRRNRIPEEQMSAQTLAAGYRLDDLKFDIMTFGKGAAGPNNEYITGREKPFKPGSLLEESSSRLHFDLLNKVQAESDAIGGEKIKTITKRFEESLERLWKSNPASAFPSPARVRETLDILDQFKVDSPGREKIQENIERFNALVGLTLESRRLFVTKDGRLGMGPQSLECGDEIWGLEGANVPFVLKRSNEENFQLVGEAFVFGAMHGEAVKGITRDKFIEVRLV
jgi:hypothetical protein